MRHVTPAVRSPDPAQKAAPLLEARPSPAADKKLTATALAAEAYRATGGLDAYCAAPRFNVLL